MHDTDFDPVRAERLTHNLRVENRQLKARLRASERLSAQGLPARWHKAFADLRRDNAKFRIQRNEARQELAVLRAELEALRAAVDG